MSPAVFENSSDSEGNSVLVISPALVMAAPVTVPPVGVAETVPGIVGVAETAPGIVGVAALGPHAVGLMGGEVAHKGAWQWG